MVVEIDNVVVWFKLFDWNGDGVINVEDMCGL